MGEYPTRLSRSSERAGGAGERPVGLFEFVHDREMIEAGERQQLMRLLHPSSGLRPLWQDLLCFAIAPAVCEEVLFRGAILAALLGRASLVAPQAGAGARERPGQAVRAVVICALLFGAFHLSWAKLLPTAVLGLGEVAHCWWGVASDMLGWALPFL